MRLNRQPKIMVSAEQPEELPGNPFLQKAGFPATLPQKLLDCWWFNRV
jgi:hypothetical protein